jgi:hypothetical protein
VTLVLSNTRLSTASRDYYKLRTSDVQHRARSRTRLDTYDWNHRRLLNETRVQGLQALDVDVADICTWLLDLDVTVELERELEVGTATCRAGARYLLRRRQDGRTEEVMIEPLQPACQEKFDLAGSQARPRNPMQMCYAVLV